MKRLTNIISTLVLLFTYSNVSAQAALSIAVGGGPNLFQGSITEANKIGYSSYFDVKYDINSRVGVSLSHGYGQLNAARYATIEGQTRLSNTFTSKINTVDLHLYIDVQNIFNQRRSRSKVRTYLDLGAGYAFYNPDILILDRNTLKMIPDYTHNADQTVPGPGNVLKFNMGGEMDYDLSSNLAIFGSVLGTICSNSTIDGYSTKNSGKDPVLPDAYGTIIFGVRYYAADFGQKSRYSSSSKVKRVKKSQYKRRTQHIGQRNYGFERYSGSLNRNRRRPSKSYNSRRKDYRKRRY